MGKLPWGRSKKLRSKKPESPETLKVPKPPEPTLPDPSISEKHGAGHIADRR